MSNYTKHVYMGSQRITSKVSISGIFNEQNNPVNTTDLQAKLTAQTAKIKERFDSLGVKYSGVQQTGGLISSSSVRRSVFGEGCSAKFPNFVMLEAGLWLAY